MKGPNGTRRSFLKTNIGVVAAVLVSGRAALGEATKDDSQCAALRGIVENLNLPNGPVDVTAAIAWADGKPVVGAKVIDHCSNQLVGVTGSDGKLQFSTQNGAILRLVEPKYGQQQALRIVQGELKPNSINRVAIVGEGWTIN